MGNTMVQMYLHHRRTHGPDCECKLTRPPRKRDAVMGGLTGLCVLGLLILATPYILKATIYLMSGVTHPARRPNNTAGGALKGTPGKPDARERGRT